VIGNREGRQFITMQVFQFMLLGACLDFAAFGMESPDAVSHSHYATQRSGEGGDEYWIFTPDDPRAVEAPVVVFLHGWGGMDPYLYGAWIKHLVLRGNIVIYPRFQANIKTKLDEMTPSALRAVQAAYKRLRTDGPVKPNEKMAVVGHSMGGFVAVNVAALASENGLPAPAVLMGVEPGDGEDHKERLGGRLELADLKKLPDSMVLLLVTGDADTVVGDKGAGKIWGAMNTAKVAGKAYVTLGSDLQTMPKDAADHMAPLATDDTFDPDFSLHRPGSEDDGVGKKGFFARRKEAREQRLIERTRGRWAGKYVPDAMDYNGYWKMLDAMLEMTSVPNQDEHNDAVKKWLDGFDRDGKPGSPRVVRRVR
jgi:acetyl esterase/lipase